MISILQIGKLKVRGIKHLGVTELGRVKSQDNPGSLA
jgi:hypothetical protein